MSPPGSGAAARRPAATPARDRNGWGGPVVVGLTLFVALSLAHAVIVDGLGDRLAANRPSLALSLGRDSPDVLSAAAEDALRRKNDLNAARLSLSALSQTPLNVRALRVRALALEGLGRTPQAKALFQFAGSRGWRDNQVQAWLLRDALSRRRYGEAFLHADALARRRQELWPSIFLLFEFAAADPAGADALAQRLAQRPNWREAFLEALARSPQQDAAVAHVFQLVDRGPAALSMAELGDLPGRLAREGRYREAFQALKSFKAGRSMAEVPFDGAFADRQGVAPFTWDRVGKTGVTLDFAPSPGRLGHNALRVGYDGFSSTDLLRQALALEPGDYRLTGDVHQEEGDPRLLSWAVRCIADGRTLATISQGSDSLGAPDAWRPFSVTFTTPATGCDGVWLVLTGAPGERRSSIVTWYDKIQVVRLPVVAPPGGSHAKM